MKRKQLVKAMRDRRYVTMRRRRGWQEYDGFVAAVGDEWFALLHAPHVLYQGLVLMRVADVGAVKERGLRGRTKRALKLDGAWPPAVPESLVLDDTRSVLFTAGSLAVALGIGHEDDHPGVFVAAVERITRKRLVCREVDPDGTWGRTVSPPLARLTQVLLWDPYVERITALAEAPR